MHDPFSVSIGSVPLPAFADMPSGCEPDLFFSGRRFLCHLNETYESFDIVTYSMSKALYAPLKNVNRVIFGLRQRGTNHRAKEARYLPDCHAKIFVCHLPNAHALVQGVEIYVGSLNLTQGTTLNIMVRVRPEHVQPLLTFYEYLWKIATPLNQSSVAQPTISPLPCATKSQ